MIISDGPLENCWEGWGKAQKNSCKEIRKEKNSCNAKKEQKCRELPSPPKKFCINKRHEKIIVQAKKSDVDEDQKNSVGDDGESGSGDSDD